MSNNLPSVTSNIPRDLRNFIDRLRETVNGNGLSRLISAQDLVTAGIATSNNAGTLTPAAPSIPVYGAPASPTGLTATPSINNVVLTWDIPASPTHAYTEIWGAATDAIGTASLLGQTPGAVYSDALGPSATRYYWIRFVNTQFLPGPYNSVFGTSATTGPALTYTMGLLSSAYGVTSDAPFFQLDAPQVIGGVTIPAGTYMKAAFIYDGVITNAAIADAAIDNAKISDLSATKITAGYLNAERIEAGTINAKITSIDTAIITSGFIDAARINTASIVNAEINAAKITTGYIDVAVIQDGTITNAKIANVIQSGSYVSGSDGWKIDKNGDIELNDAVFRGTLSVKSAATGARLEINNSVIKVYDSAGTLRVKLGDLNA